MVDFMNPVWETPILPPVPGTVRGAAASLALTDRKKRDWKLLRTPIEDVPSPFSEKQDYDFDAVPEAQWESIVVPGELAMQGVDVQNNREYYYRRTVRLPRTMPKGRVFLRSHVGGFTAWDCEVTEFAKAGAFRLVVGVADIEGGNQGIWNPDGQKVSDGAWASYYAHHNIGGILRGVTLVLQSAAGTVRLRFFSEKYAGREASVRVLRTDVKGITALLHAEHGKTYRLHLRNASGTVEASVLPASPAACFGTLRAELMLPARTARIAWKKQSLYDVYPLSHIDRPIGEARRLPAHAVPERYEKAPTWDWAQDTANFFLYKAGEPHNRTATRDFRCRRDRIEWFSAQMENGYALQASAKQSRFGAGVTCEKAGDRLCLVHGWGYPDLQWGNYTGGAHPFLRQPRFAFCLRLYADSVHK